MNSGDGHSAHDLPEPRIGGVMDAVREVMREVVRAELDVMREEITQAVRRDVREAVRHELMRPMWTTAEIAAHFSVSESTVRRRVDQWEIPYRNERGDVFQAGRDSESCKRISIHEWMKGAKLHTRVVKKHLREHELAKSFANKTPSP